ncbi:hypothetical protein F2Q68_00043702 [Brassica cretica]|uniref:SWIM-type domain-containing protein n=1 Tax=Brassica cretica TaxID=69181 RepID=A0A8S9LGS2_BRACR|nr:hypothetical protein F2Q68_00043702 [Brassica cretica]
MRNVVSRYKSKGLAKLEVTAVIETHIRLTKGSKIANITDWSYQVKGVFGHSYTVALDNKVCSCQVFQKLKIPCGHALLVDDYVGLPHVQLVGDCYKTQSWKDMYSGVIYPESPFGELHIPPAIASLNLQPPNTCRPSGRPKDQRIPSTGEIQVPKKYKSEQMWPLRCFGTQQDWSYQVKGVFGHSYTVALDNKVCSCKVFQKLKIPCGHALLVADYVGLPHVQLVGDCYKTQSWKDMYSGVIYLEAPFGELHIPPAIASLNLQPPNTRRPSGRPKDQRIPSTGEIQVPRKNKSEQMWLLRCFGTQQGKLQGAHLSCVEDA